VGEYKDDAIHGHGTYTFANGDVYTGQNKDDLRHGYGTMTYADGSIKDGKWENDEYVGS
jgi:hypothetical protein